MSFLTKNEYRNLYSYVKNKGSLESVAKIYKCSKKEAKCMIDKANDMFSYLSEKPEPILEKKEVIIQKVEVKAKKKNKKRNFVHISIKIEEEITAEKIKRPPAEYTNTGYLHLQKKY